ncbi:hypothetical protein MSAN_00882200 [Mycena sanguinolenta]|uniref:Uncharacterized protein n=1 Tax=Mycena sanguinolenta TaxID=230812 RepID=A0A8H6YYQ5_9AGAR|nr:hypothetical protein MSAN_00882200 [Mycena sanguinolenta]
MSTTLPRLDAITGALLIGTWASSLLYMAELLQVLYYFRTFKKDNWKLKSYVAVAFAVDTISALAQYACVYLYTITHAGDLVYLTKQNWAVPLAFICSNCVAFLVQSFLSFRYWRFTKNTIMLCFLFILILAAFGGAVFSALTIMLFPAFKDRNKIRICGTVYLVTQAVIAVLAVIAFLVDDESNIAVGLMYACNHVYVLSMLIHLNIRKSGRSKNSTRPSVIPVSHIAMTAEGPRATYW